MGCENKILVGITDVKRYLANNQQITYKERKSLSIEKGEDRYSLIRQKSQKLVNLL